MCVCSQEIHRYERVFYLFFCNTAVESHPCGDGLLLLVPAHCGHYFHCNILTVIIFQCDFSVGTPKRKTVINVIKDSSLPTKASAWHHVSVLAQESKINITSHITVWKV
ncbi:hypothetical protein AV530_012710 [Patagioenas fasciata monilis]|uniref:Uncharacterized protein n=1 Tax=Patagioenas fasciata monilis TaxID=372326 RepID=A0A1V4JBV6_PATFA|nr:hypothetical protein AV530_012710 [Patagioenas fasciata monilis]